VQDIGNLKYDERLKILGLTRLENRRIRSDLTETYKIINNNYDINSDLFLVAPLAHCESRLK